MRNKRGFTLIELSIVLLIIAVIVGSALKSSVSRLGFAQTHQTEKKLERIQESLAVYYAVNGALPCPALPTLAANDASFGNIDCTNTYKDSDDGDAIKDFYVGTVPISALNLSDEFAFDAWGHRFTYIVDGTFVSEDSFDATTSNAGGLLTITGPDISGSSNTYTDNAIYVLISYGDNGHGAWPENGGTSRIDTSSTDVDELINADDPDTKPFPLGKVFVQAPTTATFDDMVRYRTKWQLAYDAGRQIFSENPFINICREARLVLEPTNILITGPLPQVGPVGCDTTECNIRQLLLAEAVYDRCN